MPKSPLAPSRKGSIRDILRKNSLKRCISNASLAACKDDGTTPPPRQRRVLRKNYPSTSRSESKLLLVSAHEEPTPRRTKSTSKLKLTLRNDEALASAHHEPAIYWPLDLLPAACPNARIVTWGCQMLSTKGRLLPAQRNIFDHAEDLLREFAALRQDTRTAGRGIVLVAHGLGGIVAKEVGDWNLENGNDTSACW